MKEEQGQLIQNESQREPTRPMVICGYFATLVSTVAFATSGGFSQALGGYVPAFELNLWRFGTQVLLAGSLILLLKLDIRIPKDQIPWLLLLCFAYNAHNTTFYESSIYLPVTEMICINNVSYLLISFFLTLLLYKLCSWFELLAIGVCITGVILVTQPRMLFPGSPTLQAPTLPCPRYLDEDLSANTSVEDDVTITYIIADSNNVSLKLPNVSLMPSAQLTKQTASNEWLGDGLSAASAVFVTIRIFTTNKKLQGLNPFVIAFWVAVSGVMMSSIVMAAFETPIFPQDLTCRLLLLGHALTASTAALLATVGELNIPPTIFGLIASSETLVLLGAQYTVLKTVNPGRENSLEIIGVILLFIGTAAGPIYSLCEDLNKSESSHL